VLCYKCHLALDDYLFDTHRRLWNDYREYGCDEKTRVQFHAIANQRLKDTESHVGERRYKGVPSWLRSAIEQGKVVPNAKDIYIVTEENGIAAHVQVVEKEALRKTS
jgi:hypothetical protein